MTFFDPKTGFFAQKRQFKKSLSKYSNPPNLGMYLRSGKELPDTEFPFHNPYRYKILGIGKCSSRNLLSRRKLRSFDTDLRYTVEVNHILLRQSLEDNCTATRTHQGCLGWLYSNKTLRSDMDSTHTGDMYHMYHRSNRVDIRSRRLWTESCQCSCQRFHMDSNSTHCTLRGKNGPKRLWTENREIMRFWRL